MLSNRGRQKVADMLNAIEQEGMLPYQMEIVLMVLLAKP